MRAHGRYVVINAANNACIDMITSKQRDSDLLRLALVILQRQKAGASDLALQAVRIWFTHTTQRVCLSSSMVYAKFAEIQSIRAVLALLKVFAAVLT